MTTMTLMTNSSPLAPAAAPARVCYFVTFASTVHGGPISEPVYATSPAEALATFNASGPAVRVLSVGGPDFTEYAVVNGEIVDETDDVTAKDVTAKDVTAKDVTADMNATTVTQIDALARALQDPHLDAANRAQILTLIQRLTTP